MGNAQSVTEFRERIQMVIKGKPPTGAEFWLSLWTAQVPTTLIFEVLTPAVIQEMRERKPENLTTLIKQATIELRTKAGGVDGVMRSLEILTRIIPPTLKPGADKFEATYLFPTDEKVPSLGIELLNALLELLFEPGFCVSSKLRKLEATELTPLPTHLWAAGMPSIAKVCGAAAGSWAPTGENAEKVYTRRIAVLRCLLACLSGCLNNPVEKAANPANNKFVEILFNPQKTHPKASGLFFSALNTILSYDPVGWGLPYNYLFSSSVPEQLVECCISILSVMLSYANDVFPVGNDCSPNYFIQIIRKLRKPESFDFLFSGLVRLLEASTIADSSAYLYEKRKMGCVEGVVSILFIILMHNKKFIDYISIEKDIGKILVPLMYTILSDSHLTPSAHSANKKLHNVTEICFSCLIVMSSNTEFCNALNAKYTGTIPSSIIASTGENCTRADIVIAPLLKISSEFPVDTIPTKVLLTFLANASPYIKSVPVMYSEKICSLFIRSSKPHFLAKSSTSYLYPATILEIISKFIIYQTQGAFELIYSVICYEKEFNALREMSFRTFTKALSKAKKAEEEKKAKKTEEEKKKGETVPEKKEVEEAEAFVPTEEWFNAWKEDLIFKAITRIYKVFLPRIKSVAKGEANDRDAIINLIKTSNLVGVIPEFKGISVRLYTQNAFYAGIFTKFVWVQAIKKSLLMFGSGVFKDTQLLTDPAGIDYEFNPEIFKTVKKSSHINSEFYSKNVSDLEKKEDVEEPKEVENDGKKKSFVAGDDEVESEEEVEEEKKEEEEEEEVKKEEDPKKEGNEEGEKKQ